MNTFGAQWCGYFFMLCYTHLNLAILLLKTVLINFHHCRCIIFSFGNCMYSKHHPVKILKILFQINPLFELIKNLRQKTSLTKFEVQQLPFDFTVYLWRQTQSPLFTIMYIVKLQSHTDRSNSQFSQVITKNYFTSPRV